jgi:hypothetical protein
MMTMTTSRARVQRAHETETAVARYLAAHGWPYAEPVGAFRNGADVTGTPGLSVEVKARRNLDLPGWLRQATVGRQDGFDVPMLVHRPDGYGPERIEQWPVTFRLADAVRLLRAAGYGTEENLWHHVRIVAVIPMTCPRLARMGARTA